MYLNHLEQHPSYSSKDRFYAISLFLYILFDHYTKPVTNSAAQNRQWLLLLCHVCVPVITVALVGILQIIVNNSMASKNSAHPDTIEYPPYRLSYVDYVRSSVDALFAHCRYPKFEVELTVLRRYPLERTLAVPYYLYTASEDVGSCSALGEKSGSLTLLFQYATSRD